MVRTSSFSKIRAVIACAAALCAAAGCGGGGGDDDDNESSACTDDIQCKGTRVCQNGECIEPNVTPMPTAGTGGTGGALATGGSGGSLPKPTTGGSGGSGVTGGSGGGTTDPQPTECIETGGTCTVNGDCCNFLEGNGVCVESHCSDSCVDGDECTSDCCAALEGGGGACVPSTYCPSGGALGSACSDSTQCTSGNCNQLWCTKYCSDSLDCEGDNWCLLTGGGSYMCFPGCPAAGCSSTYSGTTCQAATTVDGFTPSVCSL
jgi:hypothetical protein